MSRYAPGPLGGYKPRPAARPPTQVPQTGSGGPAYGTTQYGSGSYDPTYMNPQGGYFSAARPAAPTARRTQPTAQEPTAGMGLLEGPGHYEDWYGEHKGQLNSPTQGFGVMNEAAGYFRHPNRAAAYADTALAPGGYFQTPGYQEGYANRQLPGLEGTKSYQEQLYESGNQGLNTFYDRERDKRQTRLEDQMSAMGVFGSGATAKGMFELEAELGAQQARDMAGLAAGADTARLGRLGEARATAGAGDEGAINRYSTGSKIAGDAEDSVARQGQGLAGVGSLMDNAEGRQLGRAGDAADRAQTHFQDRVHMPLEDERQFARDVSGLVERYTTASANEQAGIKTEIIQSIMTMYGVGASEAEAMAESILQNGANATTLLLGAV